MPRQSQHIKEHCDSRVCVCVLVPHCVIVQDREACSEHSGYWNHAHSSTVQGTDCRLSITIIDADTLAWHAP